MIAITTERLALSPSSQWSDHISEMVDWLNDPEVVRYSEQRHKKHDAESQRFYISEVDAFREIHIRNSDKFIGTITASIDRNNSVADVGILIGAKEEWGKGYGTEAWTAFCEHLLGNGIRKVEAGCMSCNFGMLHVIRKYGMFPEGHRVHHFLMKDGPHNLEYWGKF